MQSGGRGSVGEPSNWNMDLFICLPSSRSLPWRTHKQKQAPSPWQLRSPQGLPLSLIYCSPLTRSPSGTISFVRKLKQIYVSVSQFEIMYSTIFKEHIRRTTRVFELNLLSCRTERFLRQVLHTRRRDMIFICQSSCKVQKFSDSLK